MYFAISKITFSEGQTSYDKKQLASLIQKIRARFKVSIRSVGQDHRKQNGVNAIMVALLDRSEAALTQQIDSIIDFCENSGFGRVEGEETIFEDFDAWPKE
jgi:uncharacterized protein YlxP (DUF503 family)